MLVYLKLEIVLCLQMDMAVQIKELQLKLLKEINLNYQKDAVKVKLG